MKKLTLFSILLSCSICLQACQDDSNGTNCTSADNKCIDNTTAAVCVSGKLETQACTGDKPVCKDGTCVSENNTGCTTADNKCLNATTASVCISGKLETQTCTGDKPVCKDGACVSENNTGCTTADNKCLNATTASVCKDGRLETQACTGDKPLCKDGACVSENNTGCTQADNRCIGLNTASICENGKMTEVKCQSDKPNCRAGQCVKGDCEDGQIRCIDTSSPQKCENGEWKEMTACSGNTPVCSNSATTGCIAECSGLEKHCTGETSYRQCSNGRWTPELCPVQAPICDNNQCVSSLFDWCVFQWLDTNDSNKAYGRILPSDKVTKNDISAALACTTDLSLPVSDWERTPAVLNSNCSNCGNNLEYMTPPYEGGNGSNYCTFVFTAKNRDYACLPLQDGIAAPMLIQPGVTTLNESLTRQFYSEPECMKNGDKICNGDTLMRCDNGSWTKEQQCEGSTPKCSTESGSCEPECTSKDAFCLDTETLMTCEGGKFKNTTCKDSFCNSGACVECLDGDRKCDGNKPSKCENGHWVEYEACKSPTSKCVTYSDDQCVADCVEGETKCFGDLQTLLTCHNGTWKSSMCNGQKPYCFDNDTECTGLCEEGETKCQENLGKINHCVDGDWEQEDCPAAQPYCYNHEGKCSFPKPGDACDLETFYPFSYNKKIYYCAWQYGSQATIIEEDCKGECMTTGNRWDGYNVEWMQNECAVEGDIGTMSNLEHTHHACGKCRWLPYYGYRYLVVPGKVVYDYTKDSYMCIRLTD